MTPFGAQWDQLTLEHLSAFLRDAPSEPLSWEAKSTLRADLIRKQVCGFANGHDTGYLILGAQEQAEGSWAIEGITFPNGDPPSDVTNLIANGGVDPYPDGLDVQSFGVGGGKHVAVVRIPPVSTPPCNTGGTVYERVSGKTVAVTDPTRLAALFNRGDAARHSGEAKARNAAYAVMSEGPTMHPSNVQFGLGLAAVGYAPNISSRLFAPGFSQGARSSIATVLASDVLLGPEPMILSEVSQDALVLSVQAVHRLGWSWTVRASRDGAIGIRWGMDVEQTVIESIVNEPLKAAWSSAEEILGMLYPLGARYLHLMPAGGRFPSNDGAAPPPPSIVRGPLPAGCDESVLASIKRELERTLGIMAYEDPLEAD